ncbi:MAG: helix-hairpin-helix domain-containing protein [Gemmatimonas sp.]
MPTAAERQALLFLAAVALAGGGARVVAATRFEREMRNGQGSVQAKRDGATLLASQIAAVDSARAAKAKRPPPKARSGRTPRRPASVPSVAGPARELRSSSRETEPTLSRGRRREPQEPIDVNSASERELEELPRVGPALARRIVAYREEHGAFASVDDLRHVRGIGVTTASLLAPLVTFSSGYRPIRSERRPTRRDPAARDP